MYDNKQVTSCLSPSFSPSQNKIGLFLPNSALTNIVNIAKTCRTFYRKRGKHQPHKVTVRRARILCMCRESSIRTGSGVAMVGGLSHPQKSSNFVTKEDQAED